jgi:hypothetical protein
MRSPPPPATSGAPLAFAPTGLQPVSQLGHRSLPCLPLSVLKVLSTGVTILQIGVIGKRSQDSDVKFDRYHHALCSLRTKPCRRLKPVEVAVTESVESRQAWPIQHESLG